MREVRDNVAASRFEILVDDTPAGFADYVLRDGVIVFTHTEIDQAREGQGLGGELVSKALTMVRDTGLKVRPKCEFVASYIARHPEFANLLEA